MKPPSHAEPIETHCALTGSQSYCVNSRPRIEGMPLVSENYGQQAAGAESLRECQLELMTARTRQREQRDRELEILAILSDYQAGGTTAAATIGRVRACLPR